MAFLNYEKAVRKHLKENLAPPNYKNKDNGDSIGLPKELAIFKEEANGKWVLAIEGIGLIPFIAPKTTKQGDYSLPLSFTIKRVALNYYVSFTRCDNTSPPSDILTQEQTCDLKSPPLPIRLAVRSQC